MALISSNSVSLNSVSAVLQKLVLLLVFLFRVLKLKKGGLVGHLLEVGAG